MPRTTLRPGHSLFPYFIETTARFLLLPTQNLYRYKENYFGVTTGWQSFSRRLAGIGILAFSLPSFAFFLLFTLNLQVPKDSAEDAYHAGLKTMLLGRYGISGGKWLLGTTEESAFGRMVYSGGDIQLFSAADDMPFRQFIKFKPSNASAEEKPELRWAASNAAGGDMVLIMLWIKTAKDARVTLQYENQASPATTSLKAVVRLSSQWQFILLPFKAQTSGNGYFKILSIEPADTLFISAPAALNYEKSYRIYDLPVECPGLYYEGRESDAPWRQEAMARIEQLRRGQLSIKVLDAFGRPAVGAKIRYSMIRHAFGFGTAVSVFPWLQPSRDGEIYLRKLTDLDGQGHGFNTIVLENALKWPPWEDDRLHGSREQVVEIIDWLRDKNFRLRGHNLLWPVWSAMPKDMQEHRSDKNYLSNRIRMHIYEILRYPGINGRIEEWDVLNEPLWCRDLELAMGSDSIYASAFRWAGQADAAAKLYLNVNEILSAGGYDAALYKRFLDLLDKLDRNSAPVHGVGIQGHVKYELVPPKRWLEMFDDLAARGKEVSITEFDAVNIPEETAADYLRDLLIASYSHPAVKNFIMWGFWDGAHWQKDAPLFYTDWSLKPSGQVFMDYVFRRWRNDGEGVCDKTGQWSARLYYGQYEVTIGYGGCRQSAVIDFKPGNNTVFIELEPDTSPPESPKGLTLLRR